MIKLFVMPIAEQVHEEEVDFGATLLGWEITKGGLFRPARRRAWKVRFAVREMLSRGRSSSHQLEKLIGHCSFLCLGRRECFSVFGAVYKFIRHHYNQSKEFPLWREVREELMIFDGLIPLIQKDLTSPWSSAVYAVDASEGGMGPPLLRFQFPKFSLLGEAVNAGGSARAIDATHDKTFWKSSTLTKDCFGLGLRRGMSRLRLKSVPLVSAMFPSVL